MTTEENCQVVDTRGFPITPSAGSPICGFWPHWDSSAQTSGLGRWRQIRSLPGSTTVSRRSTQGAVSGLSTSV